MTFTEIITKIMDRLGYSSLEAQTRVGGAVNQIYREVGTSINLNFMRQGTASAVVSIGNPLVTFTATEKVFSVWRVSGSNNIILDEVLLAELRNRVVPSSDAPTEWALHNTSSNSVTIRLNASPVTGYTLYADAITEIVDLSGAAEPAFPESFHDILVEGVLKDEYMRLEKTALADRSQGRYEKRLSDLRLFVAKSNYLKIQQGKLSESEVSRAGSGGSVSFGTTPLVITAAWTFDRDPSAPFVVTDSSAYVANLYAEGVGNLDEDRLVGRDSPGVGESTAISVGGGIQFTGSNSIQTTAFTGDVTKSAGGTVLTIAADAVTFDKFQNIPTNSLVGRDDSGTGDAQSILLNSTLEMDGSLNLQRAALSGDVAAAAGSNTTTIPSNTVTYAKMQDVSSSNKLLGKGNSGPGDPEEITIGTNLLMSGTTLSVPAAGANTQVQFNDGGTALGGDGGLTYNKTTDALTIAGQVIISGASAGQIVFPATQNPSSNANTLDDYEEGSWTPTVVSTGGGSMTYSFQSGSFTKIGRLCFCMFTLTTASDSLNAGSIGIAGLPFTSAALTPSGGGMLTSWTGTGAAATQFRIEVQNATTQTTMNVLNAGAESTGAATEGNIDGSSTMTGYFIYQTE